MECLRCTHSKRYKTMKHGMGRKRVVVVCIEVCECMFPYIEGSRPEIGQRWRRTERRATLAMAVGRKKHNDVHLPAIPVALQAHTHYLNQYGHVFEDFLREHAHFEEMRTQLLVARGEETARDKQVKWNEEHNRLIEQSNDVCDALCDLFEGDIDRAFTQLEQQFAHHSFTLACIRSTIRDTPPPQVESIRPAARELQRIHTLHQRIHDIMRM